MREAVQALLSHDSSHGSRIAAVVDAAARLPSPEETSFAGRRFGPYRIVRELGRGGMGIVFEAERDDGAFAKRVALKVPTRAAYSPEFMYRFRDERQILARLEHPHIARLLDGGAAEDGVPYFAMEFVEGVPSISMSPATSSTSPAGCGSSCRCATRSTTRTRTSSFIGT